MPVADPHKVVLTGENPFLRLSEKDGDPNSTDASYWRILFSPMGPGHVLYLKSELTHGRWHIYSDNIAMARWLQTSVQGMLNPALADTSLPVFDASFRLFPAFAKKTGVTKWEHVNLTPQLREQSLVQGSVDFISGHYFSSMLDLKARGVKFDDIVAMRYVDFGMDLYANGIIVSADMLKNEKAIKGFIAATVKGWKDVIADNKVGIAAAKKRDPLIDEALETERLQISLQTNILTPYVKANGMGDVDPARFASSVKLVSEAFGLPTAPAPDKVFTGQYLPPKADRMVGK